MGEIDKAHGGVRLPVPIANVIQLARDEGDLEALCGTNSGQHLLGIINDILDSSKVEAGKLTIENIPFELDSVLENVVNLVLEKAAGDSATAERAAHSLKGSASALGANRLAECAGEVETAIRSGQDAGQALKTLSDSLRTAVSAIQHAVTE